MILQPLLCLPFGVSFAAPASEGAGEGLADAVVLYVDLPAAPALDPDRFTFSFCHNNSFYLATSALSW